MSAAITVRGLEPQEESWLEGEARRVGVPMGELVLRLIREKRMRDMARMKPSQAFAHYFGTRRRVADVASHRSLDRRIALGQSVSRRRLIAREGSAVSEFRDGSSQ